MSLSIPLNTPAAPAIRTPSLPSRSGNPGSTGTTSGAAVDALTRGTTASAPTMASVDSGLALDNGQGPSSRVSAGLAAQGAAILQAFTESPNLDTAALRQNWNTFSAQAQKAEGLSNAELVDAAVYQSYEQTSNEVRDIALKQLGYTNAKKQLREQLSELYQVRADSAAANPEDPVGYPYFLTDTSGAFTAEGQLPVTEVEVTAGALSAVTDDGQPVPAGTMAGLDATISRIEGDMDSFGDMSEMEMLQMQEAMFKKQQKFGMMSAILKSEHDTAMGIIRNLA